LTLLESVALSESRTFLVDALTGGFWLWIQPVDATDWLIGSALHITANP